VAIVMGLDQHRAQITADWLNTETGEVSRARLTPAHRDGVRRFLGRFAGQRLEVALEATTGWRFVVEELQAVGADVHLAEPAETSSLRGSKKRAKTDRADARHLRELVMVGRLPEAWIPPAHLLDLRSRAPALHARRPARRVAAAHPGGALQEMAAVGDRETSSKSHVWCAPPTAPAPSEHRSHDSTAAAARTRSSRGLRQDRGAASA
jgi:hypothetical protein